MGTSVVRALVSMVTAASVAFAALLLAPPEVSSAKKLAGAARLQGWGAQTASANKTTVPGHQINIRVTGDRLGQRTTVSLRGLSGKAHGYQRTITIWKQRSVKHLLTGLYAVAPAEIRRDGKVAHATRAIVKIRSRRGAEVVLRFSLRATTPAAPPTTPPTDTLTPPTDVVPPAIVTELRVTYRGPNQLSLSWTNPTDADLADIIVRRASGDTAPAAPSDGLGVALRTLRADNVTDTGLQDGQRYSYSVFTRDKAGNTSAPATVTGSTLDVTAPGPVRNLIVADRTAHSITITWANPTDADLAQIIVRRTTGIVPPVSPTDGLEVRLSAPLASNAVDTGLDEYQQYSYALFTRDTSGNTSPPTTVTGRTLDVTPPGPVTALTAGNRDYGSIELRWTNPSDGDAEKVIVRVAPGREPVGIDEGRLGAQTTLPTTRARVSELEGGLDYTFTVYVIDVSGNPSQGTSVTASTWSSTPLEPVSNLRVSDLAATSVRLTWQNPAEETERDTRLSSPGP